MLGAVRSTIGDPDLRSPYGFDSGLRPPLRMTQKRKCSPEVWGYAEFPALFF